MKRKLTALLLLLMSVAGVHAQQLQGKWMTSMRDDDADITIYLTFDRSLIMRMEMSGDIDEVGTLYMSLTVPGTYRQKGNKVHISYQKDKGDVSIDRIDFCEEARKDLDENPGMYELFKEALKPAMEEIKERTLNNFPVGGDLVIHELTPTKLTLGDSDSDGEETYTFKRVF